MDPSQDIVGISGLVKAMPALYGPNFDSSVYTPLFDNIRTGALMSKPHHCTHKDQKGHRMTRRCVTDGHQSYCTEWDENEHGKRFRCGQRLKVESGGCGKHPARLQQHSNNLLIKNLVAGKLAFIAWGELNDPTRVAENDAPQQPAMDETTQAILAQHEEDMEKLDTVQGLPKVAHAAYNIHIAFNENTIQKDRAAAEERKLKAAERKSNVTGKPGMTGRSGFAGKLRKIKDDITSENKPPRTYGKSGGKSGGKKSGRPSADAWKDKRGGKNASDLSG